MSKTSVLWGALFLLLLLLIAACQPNDDSWLAIQERGVLRVGLDPTFPPFEEGDSGELWGIDVDLARALGAEWDVDVQFSYVSYDGLYDVLATGQVDILISALVIDLSRTRDFAYSDPYFDAGQVLVGREGTAGRSSWADLDGQRIAVELGAEGHVQALAWAGRLPDLEVRPLSTAEEALDLVVQGEVDTAVVDHVTARLYRQTHPQLHLQLPPLSSEPYAIVTRLSDQTLLRAINSTLNDLQTSGQLDQILARWLD